MPFGLMLRREVVTSTRRGTAFSDRRHAAYLAAILIGGCFAVWQHHGWERKTIAGAASFGFTMFGVLILTESVLVLGYVPGIAAPAIAQERDKQTLDSLLATPASASDVVFGVLLASLLRYVNRLAALAPIVVLIMYLGGIDPRLVALTSAGLLSTAMVTASLAVAVSAGARSSRTAVSFTIMLALALMYFPLLVVLLLPRIWPAIVPWTAPIALRMLDGSPLGVIMSLVGATPRGPLVPSILRMIAIQSVASLGFVTWAILRLRPASRAIYDREGRATLLRSLRGRWRPRPACGDDPVLWREMYSAPVLGDFWRLIDRLMSTAWLGMLAYGVGLFAVPAFAELMQRGYGPGPLDAAFPELNPMARMIAVKASGFTLFAAPGQARLDFNIVLRQVTAAMIFVYYLMLGGAASETIVAERERDTWLGLIATPLTGWEILRAKMLGVIGKTRSLGCAILAIWSVGLFCGALHPLGFAAALAGAIVEVGLCVALGVSRSLWFPDRGQATGRAIGPLTMAFSLGALPFMLPGVASFAAAVGSPPFQTWAVLVSYDDVRQWSHADGLAQWAVVGVRGAAAARLLLGAWLVGVAIQAVVAVLLMRAMTRGFDAAVGRPVRSRSGKSQDYPSSSIAP